MVLLPLSYSILNIQESSRGDIRGLIQLSSSYRKTNNLLLQEILFAVLTYSSEAFSMEEYNQQTTLIITESYAIDTSSKIVYI